MRLLALLLASLLVVSGCGGGDLREETVPSPAPFEPKPDGDTRESDRPQGDRPAGGTPEGQPPADDQQAAPATGPVSFSATAGCVEEYSPQAMTGRAFAFEGTVTAIGESVTDRNDSGDLGYSGVTFRVEEWFVGDGPATFTADRGAPTKSRMSESTPSYGIGSRLLVSGEDRWGEGGLEDPIVWGCGFTRYFDENTAAAWRSAS